MTNKDFTMNPILGIRAALRNKLVSVSLDKDSAWWGARYFEELLTYTNLLKEEECKSFLNSIREAPFIPGIDRMWTGQVADYLMLRNDHSVKKFGLDPKIMGSSAPITPTTAYLQRNVDKAYWDMLPKGWAAKYYSPSQVLKIAIRLRRENDFCQHVAEKLFIQASDLEDCLEPVTQLPPVPPKVSAPEKKERERSNKIILSDFAPGTEVRISIPERNEDIKPEIAAAKPKKVSLKKVSDPTRIEDIKPENVAAKPKKISLKKVSDPPRINPVAASQPMFSSSKGTRYTDADIELIDSVIRKELRTFGGTKTWREVKDSLGVGVATMSKRVMALKAQMSAAQPNA